MNFTEINAALNSAKNLKELFPFVGEILTRTNDTAFDAWRQTPIRRLERLYKEIQAVRREYPGLENKLTDNEKYSPIAGAKKALQEYTYAVDDNKLDYLRNALINGVYGDYTLEIREQFFKMVANVQPLDILILKYLTGICISDRAYLNECAINDAFMPTELDLENYRKPQDIEYRGENKTIQSAFPEIPVPQLKLSLDRLKTQCLITQPDVGHYDVWSPYCQCVPTEMAQSFLNFICDPRNNLKKL